MNEMFYLTMHSTHFIYGYMTSVLREKQKCLYHINDTLCFKGMVFR